MKKAGFTLLELLLVIAVIGLLSGLLFSGVLSVTSSSVRSRNSANAALLRSAITEYWHANGVWPAADSLTVTNSDITASVAGMKDRQGDGRVGELTMSEYQAVVPDNALVVEQLLNGTAGPGGPPKKFLDLKTFVTSEDPDDRTYPALRTVSAHDEYLHSTSAERRKGKKLTLLFTAPYFDCPDCGRSYRSTESRRKCDGCGRHFTKDDVGSTYLGGSPYRISYDFRSNTCSVDMP